MAKLKLLVADNVSLNRDGVIRRPGEVFEAERDDEVAQWIKLGYVSEHKAKKSTARRKAKKSTARKATKKKS